MADNEIIKALLYCADEGTTCDKCILYDASDEDCECSRMLKRKAAVLIDRQRAEIEAMQAEIERLTGCVKSEYQIRAIMKSQMATIVKEIVNEQIDVAMKVARAEAIREFAERLKAEMENCASSNEDYYYLIGKSFVDEIAEEMAGDAE